MKFQKIICLALAVTLIAGLCGCQPKEKKEPLSSVSSMSHSINILARAEQGEIPELPFALGTSVATVKDTFMDYVPKGSEIYELGVSEGEKTVWLQGGSTIFCYEKEKESLGISVLVAQEYAFDLSMGGVYAIDDVIAAVGTENFTRATATYQDAFFLPVIPEGSECLTYTAGRYQLKFIFIDGYAAATVLIDPENWQG